MLTKFRPNQSFISHIEWEIADTVTQRSFAVGRSTGAKQEFDHLLPNPDRPEGVGEHEWSTGMCYDEPH